VELLAWLLYAYQFLVLYYFAVLNFLYATFALFGLWMVARYARELSELSLKDLLERRPTCPFPSWSPPITRRRPSPPR
jgi:hypothetical protein